MCFGALRSLSLFGVCPSSCSHERKEFIERILTLHPPGLRFLFLRLRTQSSIVGLVI